MKRQYSKSKETVLELDLSSDWVVIDASQWRAPDPRAEAFVAFSGGLNIEEAQCSLYIKESELDLKPELFIEQTMLKHNPYCQGPDGEIEVAGKTAKFFDWTDGIGWMRSLFVLKSANVIKIEFSWARSVDNQQAFERLSTILETIRWSS